MLLVLLVGMLSVPALGLAWLWQWAEVEAEPPPTTTTTLPEGYDDPAPELDTELLSMRRGGADRARRRAPGTTRTAPCCNRSSTPCRKARASRSTSTAHASPTFEPTCRSSRPAIRSSLVAAVALDVLGEDHRFRTELRGAQPVDGVITGDVYLVGGGDPLLVTADYVDPLPLPAFNTTSLDVLADALARGGSHPDRR